MKEVSKIKLPLLSTVFKYLTLFVTIYSNSLILDIQYRHSPSDLMMIILGALLDLVRGRLAFC
jgi:hypothetical protein